MDLLLNKRIQYNFFLERKFLLYWTPFSTLLGLVRNSLAVHTQHYRRHLTNESVFFFVNNFWKGKC